MQRPNARMQAAEPPWRQDDRQRGSMPVLQEVENHGGEPEMVATQLNLQLWDIERKLHAMLEADSDGAVRVLVKAGLLLRMDEIAALRKAVQGMLS